MIFRQLFDKTSSTYTYLIASRVGGEALIIDPVIERVDRYLKLLGELDLKLIKTVDTHVHADHISGMGALRDQTRCVTMMGAQSSVDVVSMRVSDGAGGGPPPGTRGGRGGPPAPGKGGSGGRVNPPPGRGGKLGSLGFSSAIFFLQLFISIYWKLIYFN